MKLKKIESKKLNREDWLKLRAGYVSSTESAIILGYERWGSLYSLWHQKAQTRDYQSENASMKRGKFAESFIANMLAEHNGWDIEPIEEYLYDKSLRVGATFDYLITSPFRAILEIKSSHWTDFQNEWVVDEEEIKPPFYYNLQVQHQLMFRDHFNVDKAVIGVATGLDIKNMHTIDVNPVEKAETAILEGAKEFWDTIKKGEVPSPDYAKDFDFMRTFIYGKEPKNKEIEATPEIKELVKKYGKISIQETKCKTEKKEIQAKLLEFSFDYEKIKGDGFSVSCKFKQEGEKITPPSNWQEFVPKDLWNVKTIKASRNAIPYLTKKLKEEL